MLEAPCRDALQATIIGGFASSVSLSGDDLIVGAYSDDSSDSGTAYLYDLAELEK